MASVKNLSKRNDPYFGFPCLLAIRDLKRLIATELGTPLNTRKVAHLLALDPIALVRGLRIANSPLQNPTTGVSTIRECIQSLGGAACAHLFRVPALDCAGTSLLRKHWLHALATALAAADLAEATGDYQPEKAYAAGLLHNLPAILGCIRTIKGEDGRCPTVYRMVEDWHLPKHIIETIKWFEQEPRDEPKADTLTKLISAAAQMADIAGFAPETTTGAEDELLKALLPETELPTRNLPELLNKALAHAGLKPTDLTNTPASLRPMPKDQIPLDGKPLVNNLAKACNTTIEFSRGEGLTTNATALVTALRKYLDYDRVYFFKWSGPGRIARFRLANDTTPSPHGIADLEPTRQEMAFLGRLVGQTEAGILERPTETPTKILDLLGTDSVAIAPVIARSKNQGFIVADLALRGCPVGKGLLPGLQAVCGLAALSIESQKIQRVATRHGYIASVDPLTAVTNRRQGLIRLNRLIEEERESKMESTLVMLDVDKFKQINDTFGHLKGDVVLKAIAQILLTSFDDIGTVTRIGGEEFLIIIPDHSPQEVLPLVQETIQQVENYDFAEVGLGKAMVTVSMGVTTTREDNLTLDALMFRVDQALYAAKQRGRNRYAVDLGDLD